MFSFRAYFWNDDVYINEKYKYAAGETLTAYLNTDYLSLVENLRYDLKSLKMNCFSARTSLTISFKITTPMFIRQ